MMLAATCVENILQGKTVQLILPQQVRKRFLRDGSSFLCY
jgi:hypothetical protein